MSLRSHWIKCAILPLLAGLSACVPTIQSGGTGDDADWPRYRPDGPVPPPVVSVPPASGALPKSGPAATTWDGGRVIPNATAVTGSRYVVQPGDTLRSIGNRTGAGSEAIAAANGLQPPFVIKVGQTLTIPAGRFHTVSAGETGIAIARAYGVRWADVVTLNALEPPYVLRIGQKLKLPDGGGASDLNIADVVSGGQPALAEGGVASAPVTSSATGGVPLDQPVKTPGSFGGRFAWPLNGTLVGSFGSKGGGKVNDGLILSAPVGTMVKASAPGVVIYAGAGIGVLGGLVLVDHGGGWVSAYGNLGRYDVVRGQSVTAGQGVGTVGDTGYGDGPRLHFQIRRDLKPVDPALQLPQR